MNVSAPDHERTRSGMRHSACVCCHVRPDAHEPALAPRCTMYCGQGGAAVCSGAHVVQMAAGVHMQSGLVLYNDSLGRKRLCKQAGRILDVLLRWACDVRADFGMQAMQQVCSIVLRLGMTRCATCTYFCNWTTAQLAMVRKTAGWCTHAGHSPDH